MYVCIHTQICVYVKLTHVRVHTYPAVTFPCRTVLRGEVTRQREGWGESSRALARGGEPGVGPQPLSSLPACTTLQTSSLSETLFRPQPL